MKEVKCLNDYVINVQNNYVYPDNLKKYLKRKGKNSCKYCADIAGKAEMYWIILKFKKFIHFVSEFLVRRYWLHRRKTIKKLLSDYYARQPGNCFKLLLYLIDYIKKFHGNYEREGIIFAPKLPWVIRLYWLYRLG